MPWLQKRDRRIFFRHTFVAENDRIRRELRAIRFVGIPLIDPVIKDEQRAAVFNKLQQTTVDRDQS